MNCNLAYAFLFCTPELKQRMLSELTVFIPMWGFEVFLPNMFMRYFAHIKKVNLSLKARITAAANYCFY